MAKKVNSKVKGTLIIFVDIKGSVHKELFILAGQSVNSTFYCDVLQRPYEMCQDFALTFGDKRMDGHFITTVHHLNTYLFTENFLPKQWTAVTDPPYSPELAPCDFCHLPGFI
jgi:hypothetical protein